MEYQIDDRVETQHGEGTVVMLEQLKGVTRYGVRLDTNPFAFTPVFYWPHLIEKIPQDEGTIKEVA
jgi:hypothetical protein